MTHPAPPSTHHAHTTLARWLTTVPAGAVVTADTWAAEADAAQLSSAEIGGAMLWAWRTGLLDKAWAVGPDGGQCPYTVASRKRSNKGRRLSVYTRTTKETP